MNENVHSLAETLRETQQEVFTTIADIFIIVFHLTVALIAIICIGIFLYEELSKLVKYIKKKITINNKE